MSDTAERIRAALDNPPTVEPTRREQAYAALDELVAERDRLAAELKEATQRIRDLEADPDRPNVIYAGDELEAAEEENARLAARVEELEAAARDFTYTMGVRPDGKLRGFSYASAYFAQRLQDVLQPGRAVA